MFGMTNAEYSAQMANMIIRHHCKLKEYRDILGGNYGDIDDEFLGFTNVYYSLLFFVPEHFTIVDFGCATAPQAWLFRNYKKYIGVDVFPGLRFTPPNAVHLTGSIFETLPEVLSMVDPVETFAICSYVPSGETELVRRRFPNVLVYYPHGGK